MIIDLDLETTGLDWQTDRILLNGYKLEDGQIIYCSPDRVDDCLDKLLSDSNNYLRGANIKFDALFLASQGYKINCGLIDTRVMAYTCWPELEEHGLKYLCEHKLGAKYERTLETILFKPLKDDRKYLEGYQDYYYVINGKYGQKDHIEFYHKEDILNISKISNLMRPSGWFWNVEVHLTKILFETELRGIQLDI